MHTNSAKKFWEQENKRILIISLLMLLIISVRLFYYTGPIFANSQDEGIYLTMFSQTLIFRNQISFSEYRGINFSNYSTCHCNPADMFQFYVGLDYPEMFLQKILGYSADLAIFYVIFTSMIEGLFIFLIIEKISSLRAAIMGSVLFAFIPIDVLFATHVQPQIPAMMLIAISTYLFIVANESKKKRFYLLSGLFAGFAYITNPVGSTVLMFFALVLVVNLIRKLNAWRTSIRPIIFLIVGFLIAYSTIGSLYFLESGNYLLYPTISRAIYFYQDITQPISSHCLANAICLKYVTGYPAFYPSILLNLPTTEHPILLYFGLAFYLFVFAILITLIHYKTKRNKWALTFVFAFVFYLLLLMFLPTNTTISKGQITIYPISEDVYTITLLTLPIIVITALGMENLLSQNKKILKFVVLALILIIIMGDLNTLNRDTGFYRASMSSLHTFVGYVKSDPNATFYTNFLFAGEANLITGYKYKVNYLQNCTKPYLQSLDPNALIVTGGTISIDIDPSAVTNFDQCTSENITNYVQIYQANNLYSAYSDTAPPLAVYRR